MSTKKVIAASGAACRLLNKDLMGLEFLGLLSDRGNGDRLWAEMDRQGYAHNHITFVGRNGGGINATIASETIKLPSGNSYAILKLIPEIKKQ